MQIAFDVGNVLVDVNFKEFCEEFRQMKLARWIPYNIEPLEFACDIQAAHDLGIETLETALRSRFSLRQDRIRDLVNAWNKSIHPNDEMLDFIDELRGDGVEVAILSNMAKEHAAYIRKNHPRIFNGNILHLSSEVGARKPNKLYYQSFLMQYPHFKGAIFLDDRKENLVMAEKFGLCGYHFELNKFVELKADERADKLQILRSEFRPHIHTYFQNQLVNYR